MRIQASAEPPTALRQLLETGVPPQPKYGYDKQRWLRWTGHLESVASVIEELPVAIDRRDVGENVARLRPSNVAGAFVVPMIWGHGESGYGPYRAARALTGSTLPKQADESQAVLDRLAHSAAVVLNAGPIEAFRQLSRGGPSKVPGLGPAFFTKWLYAVSMRGNPHHEEAAPVLDKLVAQWLKKHANTSLRYGSIRDYELYVNLLQRWGRPYGLAPAAVEEGIFHLVRREARGSQE